jgi:hypothetical protein
MVARRKRFSIWSPAEYTRLDRIATSFPVIARLLHEPDSTQGPWGGYSAGRAQIPRDMRNPAYGTGVRSYRRLARKCRSILEPIDSAIQHTLEGRFNLHLSLPVEPHGGYQGEALGNNAILCSIVESDLVSCLFLLHRLTRNKRYIEFSDTFNFQGKKQLWNREQ